MERIVLTYNKDGYLKHDVTISALNPATKKSRVLFSLNRFGQHTKALAQLNAPQIRFVAKLIIDEAEKARISAVAAFSKGMHSLELPRDIKWLKKLIEEADGRELPTPA